MVLSRQLLSVRRFVVNTFNPHNWSSRTIMRGSFTIFIIFFIYANFHLWTDSPRWDAGHGGKKVPGLLGIKHPIVELMNEARHRHEALLSKQTKDVKAAAAAYRDRRGRHPPPGFDTWYKAALASDAIMVEDFFDRIYKDLTPFWALDPKELATKSAGWKEGVKVRDGKATRQGKSAVSWIQHWTDLVAEFSKDLPDLDMPVNIMDESRLLVPFEKIAEYVQKEQKERTIPDISQVTTKMTGLKDIDASKPEHHDPAWLSLAPGERYWDLAVKTCNPNSPSYNIQSPKDWKAPAEWPVNWQPSYAYKGYIRNWTEAMDACVQPHLGGLHGTFVEPISLSSTAELIPLFGGSKLPQNNEILIPGAMYLADDERYSGGNTHGGPWGGKLNKLIWRGVASGGRAHEDTWHHLQRHRLIQMLNTTVVAQMEADNTRSPAFRLPPQQLYHSKRQKNHQLGSWLSDFANFGFIELCHPNDNCDWLRRKFKIVKKIDMSEQYDYKFLPDIDGNSFSARFRGFLQSTSLPLKATIYAEWHDDRLTPWLHFAPLDNTFQDMYASLEFFSGAGDLAAQHMAESGKKWAEKVLRREDMKLYVWRLLLEWARVCDPQRKTLGYVDDLR